MKTKLLIFLLGWALCAHAVYALPQESYTSESALILSVDGLPKVIKVGVAQKNEIFLPLEINIQNNTEQQAVLYKRWIPRILDSNGNSLPIKFMSNMVMRLSKEQFVLVEKGKKARISFDCSVVWRNGHFRFSGQIIDWFWTIDSMGKGDYEFRIEYGADEVLIPNTGSLFAKSLQKNVVTEHIISSPALFRLEK